MSDGLSNAWLHCSIVPRTIRSTVDAPVRTYRELRAADSAALDELARNSPRAAEVVAVLRHVREKTSRWFDDVDLLHAAADAVEDSASSRAGGGGAVIVYLPAAMSPPAARFVRSLGARRPCTLSSRRATPTPTSWRRLIDPLRSQLTLARPVYVPPSGGRRALGADRRRRGDARAARTMDRREAGPHSSAGIGDRPWRIVAVRGVAPRHAGGGPHPLQRRWYPSAVIDRGRTNVAGGRTAVDYDRRREKWP